MLCAFKLTTNNLILKWISFNSLYCHGTLQLRTKSGSLFLVEKDCCNKALWSLLFQLLVFSYLYSCLPVCHCLLVLVHLCSHMFTLFYLCLPMFTRVYLCLLVFSYVYHFSLVFTYVYSCLFMFNHVYSCLHMYICVCLCLPQFTPV